METAPTPGSGEAGLVLRNVRLIDELRASRRRIVAAQDERAKKLERDIHDGAQQQLVALAVKQSVEGSSKPAVHVPSPHCVDPVIRFRYALP